MRKTQGAWIYIDIKQTGSVKKNIIDTAKQANRLVPTKKFKKIDLNERPDTSLFLVYPELVQDFFLDHLSTFKIIFLRLS